MEIEIEFMSQRMVKPSSPTPAHLRHYQLSFLDQTMVPVFMPWVFFYLEDNRTSNEEKCSRLKQSLSEALTLFYPLAGRLRDNLYVDCNDQGVDFTEAKAKCTILDFLRNPNCSEINKLLPFEIDDANLNSAAFVQLTYFECGGMAVGLGLSHKIGDACSSFMFLSSWAAVARGDSHVAAVPHFKSAKLFPPKNTEGFDSSFELVKVNNIVTKRFVFEASSIATLRDKYAEKMSAGQPNLPTRIEALTAFIWSRFKAATQAKWGARKTDAVIHAINLRSKMKSPSSEQYFGNIFVEPIVAVPNMDAEDGYFGIISQMRKVIKEVNADYVKKLQAAGQDEHFNSMKERAERIKNGDIVSLNFTSWCRFPIYEVDFGWGKPAWVGSARWPYNNLVTFLDTKRGDGIEAWVHFTEEDMAEFETDSELNAFVSQTPIILNPSGHL